jgi:uncharacterized membrane protein
MFLSAWLINWRSLAVRFSTTDKVAQYGQQLLTVTSLSLLVAVSVYLFTPLLIRCSHDTERKASCTRRLLCVAIAIYCLVYGYFTFQRHYHFNSAAFDLGIQDQVIWNTAHGNWYSSSFEVRNYMGDHFKPLIAIFAPFYWLYPTVYWLLAFQTVILALGAIPTYRLASRRLRSYWAGLAIAIAYLLYPPIGYINRADFHWEATVIPTFLAAIDAADQNHWRTASIWLTLSLLGKEEIGLTVAALGIWLAWHHRSKLGLAWTVIGVAYSFTVLFGIIPAIRQGPSDTLDRYSWLGTTPLEIAKTALSTPAVIPQRLFSINGVRCLVSLFGPLAFFPLVSPLSLVLLPAYSYNMLSDNMAQHTIYFQYTAPMTPIVVAGAIYGLARVFSIAKRKQWPWLPVATLLGLLIFTGWHTFIVNNPLTDDGTVREAWKRQTNAASVREALLMIPGNAAVFTTNHYAPHLTHRRQIQIPVTTSDSEYLGKAEFAFFNLLDYRSPFLEDWTCADYQTMLTTAQKYDYGIVYYKEYVLILQQGNGDRSGLQQVISTLCK